MTQDEFDDTSFTAGISAIYKGDELPVVAVDFDERLLGLRGVTLGSDEINWVRCENVRFVYAVRGDND